GPPADLESPIHAGRRTPPRRGNPRQDRRGARGDEGAVTTTLIPVFCAVAAALVALAATPLASVVARRVGALDHPSGRRIHTRPTPRLGGLGIMAGVLVPTLYYLP